MLQDAEHSHERAEHDGPIEGGHEQRRALEPAPQTHQVANHDDLRQDRRFDQMHPVVRVLDGVLSEDQTPVPCERHQEEREVHEIETVLDHLVDDLPLPAGHSCVLLIHFQCSSLTASSKLAVTDVRGGWSLRRTSPWLDYGSGSLPE